MSAVTAQLSDSDVEAVVAYLSALNKLASNVERLNAQFDI